MLLHRISPEQISYPLDKLRAINVVSNLCLTINSSINFIIYCLVGRRFRHVMMRILCRDDRTASPLRRCSHRRWIGHDLEVRTRRLMPLTFTSTIHGLGVGLRLEDLWSWPWLASKTHSLIGLDLINPWPCLWLWSPHSTTLTLA